MSIKKPLVNQESRVRVGWEEMIERSIAENGHESLGDEWLDLPLVSDDMFALWRIDIKNHLQRLV